MPETSIWNRTLTSQRIIQPIEPICIIRNATPICPYPYHFYRHVSKFSEARLQRVLRYCEPVGGNLYLVPDKLYVKEREADAVPDAVVEPEFPF